MDPSPLHVLLVDDDPTFRELTAAGLSEHGHEAESAADGEAAIDRLLSPEAARLDVVLLDIMMTAKNGWEVLEFIRDRRMDVPVILVTARESVEERVRGLEMGADDYIIKPFVLVELVARINAVVRRRAAVPMLRFGELCLDPVTRQVRYGAGRVDVSPREFDILRVLLENPGVVQSRAALLEIVWNITRDPETNVVDVHIGRVRKKLERVGCHLLATVRGKGYTLAEPES